MITLNLLPSTKKQEIRLTQLYQLIKNLIILLLFLTTVVAIILLMTKMALQNHFNKIVDQTTLTTKYANVFSKDIKEFNRNLKAVEKIQDDYVSWTDFFVRFTSLVPDDIAINNITINENKILITGLAKTRTKLLEFEDSLGNSDLFSEVIIPLENLLTKEDVDFNIKADINLDELKKYEH